MAPSESNTPPSVYEHISVAFESFTALSYVKMGLRPDLSTGRIVSNLQEARIAIDLAAHLAGLIDPVLDAEDHQRVQGMVRDLRLNFVAQSKEAGR